VVFYITYFILTFTWFSLYLLLKITMKNTFTFVLLLLLVIASTTSSAKIWRVNNNQFIPADFSTGQPAIEAAVAGDTIFFEPSATAYGDLDVKKRLILIGPGYWLTENGHQRTNQNPATVGVITFRTASAGSFIKGMVVSGVVSVLASDISIENNIIAGVVFNNTAAISNILIAKNWIFGPSGAPNGIASGTHTVTNLFIRNNVISVSWMPITLNSTIVFNVDIRNNILHTNSYTNHIPNAVFYNNIITGGSLTFTNSTSSNNLSINGAVGSENNNISNIDVQETPIFVGGSTIDNQFRLHSNSPAKGHGIGGVDCGIFGGDDPYVLSGIVGIPAITSFNATAAGNDDIPIKVTISAVSNK
jgi:hypothetical protein